MQLLDSVKAFQAYILHKLKSCYFALWILELESLCGYFTNILSFQSFGLLCR